MIDNIKLKSRGIKGKVKVQLFNAKTGEKTYEDEGENYISRLGKEIMLRGQKCIIGANTSGWNNASNFATSQSSTYGYNASPYTRYLHLTNDTQLEDENEMRVNEPTLAWVDLTTPYADSAENRGNINEAECKSGIDTIEWVCDYKTNQANGTFQSIYTSEFSGDLYSAAGVLKIKNIKVLKEISTSGNFVSATSDENHIYAVSNDVGSQGLWKINKETRESEIFLESNPFNTWSGISVLYLNGYIYMGLQPYGYVLRRYDILNNTWEQSGSLSTNSDEIHSMATDGNNVYLITSNTGSPWTSRSYRVVKVSHSDLSLQFNISAPGLRSILFLDGEIYLSNNSTSPNISIVDKNTGASTQIFDKSQLGFRNLTLKGQGHNGEIIASHAIYNKTSTTYMICIIEEVLNQNPTFFSRRRLPNSVTKTNDQVMKITYTFTFE